MKKITLINRIICLAASAALLFSLCGCKDNSRADKTDADGKLRIVTSLFPQYDFARQVGGEYADVSLLLSPGVEAHTYDPTYADISKVGEADIFIYTGNDMEPWAAKVLSSIGTNTGMKAVNLSDGIELIKEEDEEEDHEYDPHMWLDMTNAVKMLDEITAVMCERDSEHAEIFEANSEKIKAELETLDGEFMQTVADAGEKSIVFGGRFAYKYFTQRYKLNYKTVYDCCSTDVEPSTKTVAEITDYIKTNNIKFIYHEELSDPKVARSIGEATGAELLEFSTGHNLSKSDFDAGMTFTGIMEKNLENLKKGLAQ